MIIEHDETGRITHVVNDPVPEGLAALLLDKGRPFIEVGSDQPKPDLAADYIEARAVCPRPSMNVTLSKTRIAADGVDTAVISGIPDGATVRLDENEHVVTGGNIELTSTMPATYRIAVESWPCLPFEIEIVAE